MGRDARTMVLPTPTAAMSPSGATPQPRDQRLVELVAECVARLDDEGEAALDELCAREPDLAAQLRERIARLRASGMLEPAGLADGVPERLGDFQLLRRIASGGMGVVYEARQLSMQRRVALKLVRPEMLYFPGARERFRREIEAVARLSHPGIASIHVCGEEGELPYFAMEFVEGASLSDVLGDLAERTPSTLRGDDLLACVRTRSAHAERATDSPLFEGDWPRVCTRVVRDAANIVEYAHSAGVLHRDIKPGNVLLTPAGRVVVVDFGLAALQGASTLTRSGAQLGSLPYMAPEQLRGDAAGLTPATDVYGLGVTLYELLALRRPFDADSASGFELAIAEGASQPLRERNARVSRDLETVVLCALDPDPARRYATPGELAADLSRVLADRPVQARRLGLLGRTRRWFVRKPARAATAIGAVLLAVGALWGWTESERRADETRVAQSAAREHFDVTLAAIDVLASQGGEQPIERLVSLIDAAQRALSELEARSTNSGGVESERAKLEVRRAELLEQLGRRSDAEAAFRAAAASAERMLARGGDVRVWRTLATDCWSQLGGVLQTQARWQEALEAFDRALALAEPALAEQPVDVFGRRAWAASQINRAQLLRLAGEFEEARAGFARALPLLREQLGAAPADAQLLDMYGLGLSGSAQVEWRSGAAPLAFELWREALDVLERAHRLAPDERGYADDVGATAAHLGRALLHADQLEAAERALDQARAVQSELAARHPEFPDYRQRLAQTLDSVAWLARKRERNDDALALYRTALQHIEELAARYPESGTFVRDLAVTLTNLGGFEYELELYADALAHYARASELYDGFGAEVAPDGPLADAAVWSYLGHGASALLAGEFAHAVRALERAAALERPNAEPWVELARIWRRASERAPADWHWGARPPLARALDALRKALELGWRDEAALASDADLSALRAQPGFAELLEAVR